MRYLLLTVLLSWLCCACNETNEQQIQKTTIATLEQANDNFSSIKTDVYRQARKVLEDNTKAKYRAIQPVMDTVIAATRQAKSALEVCEFALRHQPDFSASKRQEHLAQLVKSLASSTNSIDQNFRHFLNVQGDSIGLAKDEADLYLEQTFTKALDLHPLWKDQAYLKLTDNELRLLLAKSKSDLIQREALLIYQLAQFTGSLYCTNDFVLFRRPFFFSTT